MKIRIEEMGGETRLRIVRANRGERPAGQTSCHGMKKDDLFFHSGCDSTATTAPERGVWDVFKKFLPACITKPATVPPAHAFDMMQELSTRELRKRAFDAFDADDLEGARNCYLLLLVREPGQEIYHHILSAVVETIRDRQDAQMGVAHAA